MSVRVIIGDCREALRDLPSDSVHVVVTSPPYWGLRDYGNEMSVWGGRADCAHSWGAIERGKRKDMLPTDQTSSQGRSGTDERQDGASHNGGQFCIKCGAWRGVLGLESSIDQHLANIVAVFQEVRRVLRPDGTVWLNYGDCYATSPNGRSAAATKANGGDDRTFRDKPFSTVGGALKPKDLVLLPARIALALQADGWWLRSDIIWHKPNPMPESIKDRPTTAHEHVFLLAKSARYYFDAEAVREPASYDISKMPDGWDTGPGAHGTIHRQGREKGRRSGNKRRVPGQERIDGATHVGRGFPWEDDGLGRHIRNVWTIATVPFTDAHFATFPPALIVPCIKAGCPEGGVVLDPFGGAGTTGLVADRLGRDAILIELNPEYAAMARRRIEGDAPLFAEVAAQ